MNWQILLKYLPACSSVAALVTQRRARRTYIDEMYSEPRVVPSLDTLQQTGQRRQTEQKRVRPRLARRADAKDVARPPVGVAARKEEDVLDSVDERVEFVGDEESDELCRVSETD